MAGEQPHIGREHARAQGAIEARARQVVRGHLRGGGSSWSGENTEAAAARPGLLQAPPASAWAGPARPTSDVDSAPQAIERPPAVGEYPDSDEDFGFIDGRWTSDGW